MVKNKPILERVPTGIKGLDDAMSGGFIKDSVNLVAGSPGSGKSIFAMQYLVNGTKKYNEPGVYITFEERKDKLTQYMGNFGWDLKSLIASKKVEILEQSPVDIKKATAKEMLGLKFKVMKELKAKRLVIDSISAFSLLFQDDFEKRTANMQLFEMLRDWGVTTLLTAEYDIEDHKAMPLDFEVDSIVWLYNMKKTDVRTRALEIYKMRGSRHLQKIFPLEISDRGIIIYPEQSIF